MLLSSIGRLNPYVDLKKIVIGIMDRLSSFGNRDSDAPSDSEKRKAKEEEAVARLLESLHVSSAKQPEPSETDHAAENGTKPEQPTETTEDGAETQEDSAQSAAKLPEDVKLYEIFFEQVTNLIKARGLPIQDIIALLVSLVNLALYDFSRVVFDLRSKLTFEQESLSGPTRVCRSGPRICYAEDGGACGSSGFACSSDTAESIESTSCTNPLIRFDLYLARIASLYSPTYFPVISYS